MNFQPQINTYNITPYEINLISCRLENMMMSKMLTTDNFAITLTKVCDEIDLKRVHISFDREDLTVNINRSDEDFHFIENKYPEYFI